MSESAGVTAVRCDVCGYEYPNPTQAAAEPPGRHARTPNAAPRLAVTSISRYRTRSRFMTLWSPRASTPERRSPTSKSRTGINSALAKATTSKSSDASFGAMTSTRRSSPTGRLARSSSRFESRYPSIGVTGREVQESLRPSAYQARMLRSEFRPQSRHEVTAAHRHRWRPSLERSLRIRWGVKVASGVGKTREAV